MVLSLKKKNALFSYKAGLTATRRQFPLVYIRWYYKNALELRIGTNVDDYRSLLTLLQQQQQQQQQREIPFQAWKLLLKQGEKTAMIIYIHSVSFGLEILA